MKSSIEFLYSGTVHISEDNVAELLDCAEYLQIDELKKLCSRYLDLYIDLTTDNCLKLCLLSSKYNLEYYHTAYDYFTGHLTELLGKDEMLQLTQDSVMCLISDDTLNYVPRKMFFEFLIKWVEYDLNHREQFFLELFFEIDLLLLEREYITTCVLTEELVKKSCECCSIVKTKLKCKDNLSENEIGPNDLILVVGGRRSEQTHYDESSAIYAYGPWDDQWDVYADIPKAMYKPCLALLSNSDLYIAECGDTMGLSLNVFKLNVLSKIWTLSAISLPNLYLGYYIHGILCCNSNIFVVASGSVYTSISIGPRLRSRLTRSESKSTKESMCEVLLLRMDESQSFCEIACTVFKYKGKRKIQFCGFGKSFVSVMCSEIDSIVGEDPISMFIYDDVSGKLLNRSTGSCCGQILCNFKDKFLIPIIGANEVRHKVFFIDGKEWRHDASTIIPPMAYHAERTEFQCVVYSDGLYAICGKITNGGGATKYLQSVLRFNLQTLEWNALRDFPAERVSGACVLKRPMELNVCNSECQDWYCDTTHPADASIFYPNSLISSDISYSDDYDYSDGYNDDYYDDYDSDYKRCASGYDSDSDYTRCASDY